LRCLRPCQSSTGPRATVKGPRTRGTRRRAANPATRSFTGLTATRPGDVARRILSANTVSWQAEHERPRWDTERNWRGGGPPPLLPADSAGGLDCFAAELSAPRRLVNPRVPRVALPVTPPRRRRL